ncbi:MAG: S-layer homology domain-containing protein [Acidimicrobiaceae bacterium]|nr:S-layer homology domain-containing protein [Acidimicrobiaceae bacterium]
MLQTMKKWRTELAALAACALVASALAAGAGPAAAATDRADHVTRLSACVGDAADDHMFTDVSAGHAFRDAINCVAYYGITQGSGDGSTYSPEEDVTRAQMAVFIARAAGKAGVDLGDATDAGFGDLGSTWQEARDAINRLAANGMIPSGGAFRPNDAITRAEMATFLIGLLAEAAPNVTRDSSGAILLGLPGSQSQPDDRFPDTDNAEIAAIYELGVTRGASAAEVQDDTEPPLDLNYEPDGVVDRGQMAAFITRALAHTSVRPAGLTAQYDGAEVVVSVRDARFQPMPGARIDVFWTTADQAGSAVPDDGACRLTQVTPADRSLDPCEIDATDPVTEGDGDARVAVVGLRRVPAGGATVWAWTGRIGDTLEAGVDAYRFDVAEGADIGFATNALVTRSYVSRKVRFGGSVTYSIQLRDAVGNVYRGVNGIDPAQWTVSVNVTGSSSVLNPPTQTLVTDSSGETSFSVTFDDPNRASPNELTATYTLTPADNAPPGFATVDADGRRATTGTLIFSDSAPSIAAGDATVIVDTRDYVRVSGGRGSNNVTVTVLDQYGSPFPGTVVSLASSGLTGTVTLDGNAELSVDRNGSRRFTYDYRGQGGETEALTPSWGATSATTAGTATTVYWAVDAGSDSGGSARNVLTGDVRRGQIVVDGDVGPVLLEYDDNDRFNLGGTPVSLTVFATELAAVLTRGGSGSFLTWSNYSPGLDRRVTEYDLS